MAQTKQFNIKINGTNQLVELNDLLQTNVRSLGDLKEQQDLLQQAFDQADYGTAAFDELQSSLRDVNTQIKVIDESVSDLTIGEKFEGVSRIVGAVGGAFAFASVSVQAFGEENSKTAQELQKLETQISAIIQGQQALTGIIDAFGSKNKVVAATINGLSRGFNALGISAKGAGFAIRGALIATGIGVLVAGVTYLIANFDQIKAAGAGIFKAWQPFFDGVRNFASTLTFGLIDSAAVSKIKSQADDISESITKSQEKSSKELDAINTKFELRQIDTLQKAQEVFNSITNNVESLKTKNIKLLDTLLNDKDVKDFEDKIQEVISYYSQNVIGNDALQKEQVKKVLQIKALLKEVQNERTNLNTLVQQGIITDNDLKKLDTIKNKNAEIVKLYNTLILNTRDILAGGSILFNNVPVIENAKIQQNILLTQKGITAQIDAQNEAAKAGLTVNDVKIAQLNEQARITKEINNLNEQINQEQNKRSEDNNDLLKQGIDLILSFGNALKSPEFQKDLPVFKNFKSQLEFISKNLTGTFKGIFDDILKQSPETIVSVETLTKAIEEFGKEKERTSNLNRNTAITNLQAEIDLNKELIKNSTDPNFIKVKEKQNELLTEQIKTLKDSAQKTKDEILGATEVLISSINRTVNAAKFEDQGRQLEKAKLAFQDYKNGLELSTEQASLLFEKLGVDSKVAFNTLSNEAKNAVDNNANNNLIKQLTLLKEQAKQLAVIFPEVKDAVNQYNDAIDGVIRSQKENNKQTSDNIKLLQEELALLIKAEEIRNLQNTATNTNAPFTARVDAINKLNAIELKNIDDKFKAETKGLKETDAAYQIAIINRNKAQEEQGKNTIKLLQDVNQKQIENFNLAATTTINGIGQLSDAVFGAIQAGISKQQEVLNEQLTDLNNQVTTIQETISTIDEVINSKKQTIADLEEKAKNATGGNRDEILNKLSKEFELTQRLINQKQQQQKQEKNLQNEIKKNQLEQNKLQKEANQIQKQGAVIASILATAQAGVAIANLAASNATKDFTFGVATVAGVIALGAALISTFASIRALADGGFVKSKAEGGEVDPYGYTNKLGVSNNSDSTGERPTKQLVQLHSDEYVIPRWQVNKNRSLVSSLEKERVRGMADGGTVNNNNFNNNNNDQLNNLLIANLNKPVYVSVVDINNGQQRVSVIESRSQI